MSPKSLALWHQLLDGTLPYPFSTDAPSLNDYYQSVFNDAPHLIPSYIQALKDNPYLLPYIDAFLTTMLYLHNPIDLEDAPSTIQKMKDRLKANDPHARFYYSDYVTYYFYNTTGQAALCTHPKHINPTKAKLIALDYIDQKNFKDFLKTGKATYE